MAIRNLICVSVVLVGALILPACSTPNVQTEPQALNSEPVETTPVVGTIVGKVRLPDGSGAADFPVMAVNDKGLDRIPSEPARTTTTDAAGRFRFDDVEDGGWYVIAKSGSLIGFQKVEVTKWMAGLDVSVDVAPKAEIAGRVVDTDGNPIPEASVFPVRRGFGLGGWGEPLVTAFEVKTNQEGIFQLSGVDEGGWFLIVQAHGFTTQFAPMMLTGTSNNTVELLPGGNLTGSAVDLDGNPLPDVQLILAPMNCYRDIYHVTTDSEGRFQVLGISPWRYRVASEDERWINAGIPQVVRIEPGQTVQNLEIPMVVGGTVTGRAYDRDTGEAVPDAEVFLHYDLPPYQKATKTESDGTYAFTGLYSVRHRVRVRAKGYLHAPGFDERTLFDRGIGVTPRDGQELTGIDIPFSHGVAITGRIEDETGMPVAGAAVGADAGYSITDWTTSQVDGSFRLDGFVPGRPARLQAHTRSRIGGVSKLEIDESGATDLIVTTRPRTNTISGRVFDPDGLPQAGVYIRAISDEVLGSDASAGDGTFRIEKLPPGRYSVGTSMYPIHYRSNSNPDDPQVELSNRSHFSGLSLQYGNPRCQTMAGSVVDTAGKPLPGAWVVVSGRNLRNGAITDTDGRFAIAMRELAVFVGTDIKPETTFRIDVWCRGYKVLARINVPATDSVELILEPAHEGEDAIQNEDVGESRYFGSATVGPIEPRFIEGTVTDDAGNPIAGAAIFSAYAPDRIPSPWSNWYVPAVSGRDGRFAFTTTSDSDFCVGAVHPFFTPAVKELPRKKWKSTVVNFTLEKCGYVAGRVTMHDRDVSYSSVRLISRKSSNLMGEIDADGSYEIGSAPTGDADLTFTLWSAVTITPPTLWSNFTSPNKIANRNFLQRVHVVPDATVQADFDLPPGNAVLDVYVDLPVDSDLVVEMTIEFKHPNGLTESIDIGAVTDTCSFRLEGLPAASGTLSVKSNRIAVKAIPLVLASGEPNTVDVVLE